MRNHSVFVIRILCGILFVAVSVEGQDRTFWRGLDQSVGPAHCEPWDRLYGEPTLGTPTLTLDYACVDSGLPSVSLDQSFARRGLEDAAYGLFEQLASLDVLSLRVAGSDRLFLASRDGRWSCDADPVPGSKLRQVELGWEHTFGSAATLSISCRYEVEDTTWAGQTVDREERLGVTFGGVVRF